MRALVIRCSPEKDELLAARLAENDIALANVSLLSAAEAVQLRMDADFMADRILKLVPAASDVPTGVIAYGVAAAGAIIAASRQPDLIDVVVGVNGRTDLAVDALRTLRVPTMLLVNDMPVLRVNREAVSLIKAERRLEIVHGAGQEVARALTEKCVRWLADKLVPAEAAV